MAETVVTVTGRRNRQLGDNVITKIGGHGTRNRKLYDQQKGSTRLLLPGDALTLTMS